MTTQSLAKKFDGLDWSLVNQHIKRFNAATNTYSLRDGSLIRKKASHDLQIIVEHVNDGIHFLVKES